MPWITLHNKRRVKIDRHGRIVQGIAREARGVHVRDISPFMAEYRDLEASACDSTGEYQYTRRKNGAEILRDRNGRTLPARFPRKEIAIEALLDANPELYDFVQYNWGSDSQAFKQWITHNQRGPKPQSSIGDGRFDPINVRFNLRGHHRCGSLLEALYITIPQSHRWEDITPDQLWPLEEVVGFRITPPLEALRLPITREMVTTCQIERKERKADLLERARHGRLPPKNVPF